MNLPYTPDFSDKIIAITGAGGVMMSEFVRAFIACGARVALLDINYEAVEKIASELGKMRLQSERTAFARKV